MLDEADFRVPDKVAKTSLSYCMSVKEWMIISIDGRRTAEKAGDIRAPLAAVRELCRIVELIAKLSGELDSHSETKILNLTLDADTAKTNFGDLLGASSNRWQTLPGVESVGLVSYVPMGGATEATVIRIPDHPSTNQKDQPNANYSFASTGYFSALGTPLSPADDEVFIWDRANRSGYLFGGIRPAYSRGDRRLLLPGATCHTC